MEDIMEERSDVEELREVRQLFKTLSEEIPNMIRGIIESIFSAEAGKNMGAAAANFYKELKSGGIPEDVAIKMTQNYIRTFTDLGAILREAMISKRRLPVKVMKRGKEGEEESSRATEEKTGDALKRED